MILATTTVEDVDRFLQVFGTKGADKRALHGSKGATVFRDPRADIWRTQSPRDVPADGGVADRLATTPGTRKRPSERGGTGHPVTARAELRTGPGCFGPPPGPEPSIEIGRAHV